MIKKDIEKAAKYLSNAGYGRGTNYTTNTVANLMAEYARKVKKDELADFMQWLIDEKYCLENPIEDCVNSYVELIKQQ